MTLLRSLVPALVVTALKVGATAGPSPSARAPRAAPVDHAAAAEVARIRSHFDSALVELAARDVVGLPAAQREQRAALTATLRAYRDRGVFPHNYDFPGRAVPYFTDRKTGTLCAVAHLLASSGRRDIVERVTRADNNVLVPQLAADTAFSHWLDANGLTLDEAARIQVPYAYSPTPSQTARNVAFGAVAVFAVGTSAVTTIWNAVGNRDGRHTTLNALGLASGIVTAGLGSYLLTKPGIPRQDAAVGAALGAASIALAARGIGRHHGIVLAEKRETERRRAIGEATISPIVMAGTAGGGIAVSLRF